MPKRKQQEEDDELEEEEEEEEMPTSINPYHILDLPVDASQSDIKTAYRKAALRSHPDKVAEEHKETAHKQFQEVAFAYAILSDERRRSRYDTTGSTEDSLDTDDDDFNWSDFFRAQFKDVVTEEKINDFASEYKGSEEERLAVLEAYTKCKGAMASLYSHVMLSDMLDDEERFRTIIDEAIETGEAEDFPKYSGETEQRKASRMKTAKRNKGIEADEAAEWQAELKKKRAKDKGVEKLGDLAALIQQRQKGRAENFLEGLETKYATKEKGKKGKKTASTPMEEPPEEAFAATGARKKGKTRK